jgi:hypothetical protein
VQENEFAGKTADDPIGAPRLLPAVAFGVRAAALAGLIVAGGGVAAEAGAGVGARPAGLDSGVVELLAEPNTTCCPEKKLAERTPAAEAGRVATDLGRAADLGLLEYNTTCCPERPL